MEGHGSASSGMGFSNTVDPTHGGNSSTIEFQIYQNIDPITTTSFTTTESDDDIDPKGGIDGFFTNNSFLPLVDWSSLIMFKDRVNYNKHAIAIYNQQLGSSNLQDFFVALEELDDKFRNLEIPSAGYKITLRYGTGGYYPIQYQYNRP